MNKQLLFNNNIKQAHAPVDLNAAAITGARVAIGKGEKIAIVCSMGTSTAATVQFSLKQHTAASGGSSKALATANKYYHKAGAATVFTEVEPSVAADTFDVSSIFAADGGLIVFEVYAPELDTNEGYTHFSFDIADAGAAKIGATNYILMNADKCPAYSEAI